jgi:hypothetical protein
MKNSYNKYYSLLEQEMINESCDCTTCQGCDCGCHATEEDIIDNEIDNELQEEESQEEDCHTCNHDDESIEESPEEQPEEVSLVTKTSPSKLSRLMSFEAFKNRK